MHLDQPCPVTEAVCAYESRAQLREPCALTKAVPGYETSSPPLHRHQSGIKRKEDEEDY